MPKIMNVSQTKCSLPTNNYWYPEIIYIIPENYNSSYKNICYLLKIYVLLKIKNKFPI